LKHGCKGQFCHQIKSVHNVIGVEREIGLKVARAESRRQSSEVLIVYGEEGQVEEAHQETEEPLRRTVQVNCGGLVVAKEKGANPNLNNTRGPIDWLTSSNCDGLQIDIGGVSHLGD